VEVHIGRQAILDRQKNIVGYELLFRAGPDHISSDRNDFGATANVLSGALLDLGLDRLAEGCRVLVNVPGEHLNHPTLRLLPSERIILEILETTIATEEVLEACRQLRDLGFLLVLDDYTGQPELEPLIEHVVCVKLDFKATEMNDLWQMAKSLRARGKKLLAEKLESQAQFQNAMQMGCEYFQGYLFERPSVVMGRRVSVRQVNLIQILSALSMRSDLSASEFERIVSQDVGLTVNLLRFANMASHGGAVESLAQCFLRLGMVEIRRFVAVVLLSQLGSTSSPPMIERAAVRARMCENLAKALGRDHMAPTAFLTGMLAMADSIMGVPLPQILKELHVSEQMRAALVPAPGEKPTLLGTILSLARHYECGRIRECAALASKENIRFTQITECYLEALRWGATGPLSNEAAAPQVAAWEQPSKPRPEASTDKMF
jgi:c-di-GMP-related signal transduction protein